MQSCPTLSAIIKYSKSTTPDFSHYKPYFTDEKMDIKLPKTNFVFVCCILNKQSKYSFILKFCALNLNSILLIIKVICNMLVGFYPGNYIKVETMHSIYLLDIVKL